MLLPFYSARTLLLQPSERSQFLDALRTRVLGICRRRRPHDGQLVSVEEGCSPRAESSLITPHEGGVELSREPAWSTIATRQPMLQ